MVRPMVNGNAMVPTHQIGILEGHAGVEGERLEALLIWLDVLKENFPTARYHDPHNA